MVAPYAAPPEQPAPGNGLALAGMIIGAVSLMLFWFLLVGQVVAVVGLILSAVGLGKANKINHGKSTAIAGLICSILALLAGIAFWWWVSVNVRM